MNDVNKYLGPHRKLGPGSYEIGPIHTTAKAPRGAFWGVQAGGPRGESRRPAKKNADFAWDEVMNRKHHYKTETDAEYAGIFNSLGETINRDIAQAKQAAGGHLPPVDKAKSDVRVTINSIAIKQAEYQAKVATASSLGGVYPYYLMDELSLDKFKSTLGSGSRDILGAFNAIDSAYRSALDIKRLSWEMSALAHQLPDLSSSLSQAEATVPVSREIEKTRSLEKLANVSLEINIRFQILPAFLVDNLVAAAGPIAGDHSQTLMNYKAALDQIIAANKAAVGRYEKANPSIKAPLSKPEFEALKNLVDMQANGTLGKRWQDYHVSLLHKESARHLAATAKAFAELSKRARGAEGKLRQIKREEVQEARAHAAAQAQARRAAQEEKAKRVAEKAEAQRVAQEAKAKREAEKAEAQRAAQEAKAKKEAERAEARANAEKRAQAAAKKIRAANTFNASGSAAASGSLFMTAAGAVAVVDAASLTLQAAIGEAVAALSGFAASVGAGAAVGVAALFYSSKLGNGELPERYAFSTPLSDLAPLLAKT